MSKRKRKYYPITGQNFSDNKNEKWRKIEGVESPQQEYHISNMGRVKTRNKNESSLRKNVPKDRLLTARRGTDGSKARVQLRDGEEKREFYIRDLMVKVGWLVLILAFIYVATA